MASVSEDSHDFEVTQNLRESFKEVSRVNRSGRVFLGSVLILSAIGLWMVPVSEGDTPMRLIKLLVSLVLSGLGVMFISSLSERDGAPLLTIDPKRGEMRLVHKNRVTGTENEKTYNIDDLTEVTLDGEVFTARDAAGGVVINERIRDRATLAALRASFEMPAKA